MLSSLVWLLLVAVVLVARAARKGNPHRAE